MSISSHNEDSSVSQLLPFGVPTCTSGHVILRMTNLFSPCIVYSLSGINEPNILELIDRMASYSITTTPQRAILGVFMVGQKRYRANKHGHTSPQTSSL